MSGTSLWCDAWLSRPSNWLNTKQGPLPELRYRSQLLVVADFLDVKNPTPPPPGCYLGLMMTITSGFGAQREVPASFRAGPMVCVGRVNQRIAPAVFPDMREASPYARADLWAIRWPRKSLWGASLLVPPSCLLSVWLKKNTAIS